MSEQQNINTKFISKLKDFFYNNIEISYFTKEKFIIITKEDRFFEFERNIFANENYFIASNDITAIEKEIGASYIEILSKIKVIKIKNGLKHRIALTEKGKVYCWGYNHRGVLGNGLNDSKLYDPELNGYLSEKTIIDVSCGAYHTMVLTDTGDVYSWGCNEYGQIGNESNSENQLFPDQVKGFDNVKVQAISCGYVTSVALTKCGSFYFWGSNNYKENTDKKFDKSKTNFPLLIDLQLKFNRISCALNHTILLTTDGIIILFVKGSSTINNIIELKSKNKFVDIASHFEYEFFATETQNVYNIWRQFEDNFIAEPTENDMKSFDDIFEKYFKISYNPNKQNLIDFEDGITRNNHFVNSFSKEADGFIGSGSFANVFRVTNKSDKNMYAIKKVKVNNLDKLLEKLKDSSFLLRLQYNRIIRYFDIWFEKEKGDLYFYIQMELCQHNLSNLIKEMADDNDLKPSNCLKPLGYYIANEIFIEILNGVQYLQKQFSKLILKSLTPDDILLSIGSNNSFVKIGDYTIDFDGEFAYEQTQKDSLYDAPEILEEILEKLKEPEKKHKSKTTLKTVIYSLGVILQKLFAINEHRDYNINDTNSELLLNKYLEIRKLFNNMLKKEGSQRPDCEDILKTKNLWGFRAEEFDAKEEQNKISKFYETKNSFVYKLLKFKPVLRNGEFDKKFYIIQELGAGSYGAVLKVINRDDEKYYAIKIINSTTNTIINENFPKEMETAPNFLRYKDEGIVQYHDLWLENSFESYNGNIVYNQDLFLYIQMELCDRTLHDLIQELSRDIYVNECKTSNKTIIGYYIASEIFIQILKGVNYLHIQDPKIIHRDLNPWNIMLKINSSNMCIKIVDFNLVAFHEYADQMHTRDTGHQIYQSPEIRNEETYDIKTDIYSLGVIFEELFNIKLTSREYVRYESKELEGKYVYSTELVKNLKKEAPWDRPTCEAILAKREKWALLKSELSEEIRSRRTNSHINILFRQFLK